MKYNFGFHYFTLYETLSLFCLILTITKRQVLIYTPLIHHLTERKGEGNIVLSVIEPLEMWTWVKI